MRGWRIKVSGVVQGVGFRPTVWRIAVDCGACGDVSNNAEGVLINLSLPPQFTIEEFISRLTADCPDIARIDDIEVSEDELPDSDVFSIAESDKSRGETVTDVSPDVAICRECLADINNPGHRHRYWLANCTLCGPRFTITRCLPYDRPNTTMREFALCPVCEGEYTNPTDRRFHAQPVSCNDCGPLYTHTPEEVAYHILSGEIVMLKGAGGYNLLCDATYTDAVTRLRQLKHRPRKPFAVMIADIEHAHAVASPDAVETEVLQSWRNPIVIVKSRGVVSETVAPGLGNIGIMLPGMGFQHALARAVRHPMVLTSANFPGAPIIRDDTEALHYATAHKLFLAAYNREIVNRIDDSVVRVIDNAPRLLRRARGYTPDPLRNIHRAVDGVVGMGADVSSQWGFGRGSDIILSQFIGHLHTEGGEDFLRESIDNLTALYRLSPRIVVTDKHPDYVSTAIGNRWAQQIGAETMQVWHHHAHALAVMAEYGLTDTTMALVLDGTGTGPDGTLWGCELLEARTDGFTRVWHGPELVMPGGDAAAREPWRMAVSLAQKFDIPLPSALIKAVGEERCEAVRMMCQKGFNSPITTGAGRLWDALSAWLGLTYTNGYEAEAPVLLEWVASAWKGGLPDDDSLREILIDDVASNEQRAARFHALLARQCADAVYASGAKKVILTGGVFQNQLFTNMLISRLECLGISHLLPRALPPGDGQIAAGQIYYAALNA